MAKFILAIEFVVDAANDADAAMRGRELAGLLFQQNAVDYYLLGQPRAIEAPDLAARPPAAPATVAARRR